MRILIIILALMLVITPSFSIKRRGHSSKVEVAKATKVESGKTDSNSTRTFKFENSDVSGSGSFDQDLADYKAELEDFQSTQLDEYLDQQFKELQEDNGLNSNSWRRLIEGLLDLLDYRQEGLYKLEDEFKLVDTNQDGLIDIDEARNRLNDAITLSIKNIEDYLERKFLIMNRFKNGAYMRFSDLKPPTIIKKNKKSEKSD
jgi:hypothetical protein